MDYNAWRPSKTRREVKTALVRTSSLKKCSVCISNRGAGVQVCTQSKHHQRESESSEHGASARGSAPLFLEIDPK